MFLKNGLLFTMLAFGTVACGQATSQPEPVSPPPAQVVEQAPAPVNLAASYDATQFELSCTAEGKTHTGNLIDEGKISLRLNDDGTFILFTNASDLKSEDSGTYAVQGSTLSLDFNSEARLMFYNDFSADFNFDADFGILKLKSSDIAINDDLDANQKEPCTLLASFTKR